ncbi:hypothetical protein ABT297_17395 [Dactylosporangium sp. NPDC000555]|uniref:hypothetical protein n=1 Tax=Dactylosporangium sp. NPDC000555 TaxID=3154260 RepID=UPI003324EA95
MQDKSDWDLHPDAESYVAELLDGMLQSSARLRALEEAMTSCTSTRLFDWVDHIVAPIDEQSLAAIGYVEGWRTTTGIWRHPAAQLPAIVPADRRAVAVRVDDAAAFAQAQGSTHGVDGAPLSRLRLALVSGAEEIGVAGLERRSWAAGVQPQEHGQVQAAAASAAWRALTERPRHHEGADGVRQQMTAVREAVRLVGADLAASYFLELERQYWQRRNSAGATQHSRQDRLGLGWGNNDHHTFRSSRAAFRPLIDLLTALGFAAREHFYAGADAGWGALVLEHPNTGGVIFADADLAPDEVGVDLVHESLVERQTLGTVGLWCALHGESVLSAGMHHLEGQFDFDALREDLRDKGIAQMSPFSEFPYLKQAFTEAETWIVAPARLEPLVAAGVLDATVAERFATVGAPGSHLENLARRNGFKGFNKHNVSTVIRATDARHYTPQVQVVTRAHA